MGGAAPPAATGGSKSELEAQKREGLRRAPPSIAERATPSHQGAPAAPAATCTRACRPSAQVDGTLRPGHGGPCCCCRARSPGPPAPRGPPRRLRASRRGKRPPAFASFLSPPSRRRLANGNPCGGEPKRSSTKQAPQQHAPHRASLASTPALHYLPSTREMQTGPAGSGVVTYVRAEAGRTRGRARGSARRPRRPNGDPRSRGPR